MRGGLGSNMTNRDKLGAAVMIVLFAIVFTILYWTVKSPSDSPGGFENNVIIEQRVKNLNK